MEIRFISSLTAEDENQVAPALLKAVGALLDQLPIAYTVRIQTTGAQVFQHTHTHDAPAEEAGSDAEAAGARFPSAVHPFIWHDRNES
jgi:hypothetical protein